MRSAPDESQRYDDEVETNSTSRQVSSRGDRRHRRNMSHISPINVVSVELTDVAECLATRAAVAALVANANARRAAAATHSIAR